MGMPLQITFRGMEPSPAVETRVREMVQRLDRHQDRITSCRVVIEARHRRHYKGKLYTVAVDVTYPGGEVVANRGKRFDHAHEDVYVAIRDAFNAVRRKLKDDTRIRRGNTKTHADPFLGTVVKLLPGTVSVSVNSAREAPMENAATARVRKSVAATSGFIGRSPR